MKNKKPIISSDFAGGARYSHILAQLLNELGAVEILRLNYEADYQGFVDVDARLAKKDRVFSYKYYYGSCSGCDGWEAEGHNNDVIKAIMKKEGTFFSKTGYAKWREKLAKG